MIKIAVQKYIVKYTLKDDGWYSYEMYQRIIPFLYKTIFLKGYIEDVNRVFKREEDY